MEHLIETILKLGYVAKGYGYTKVRNDHACWVTLFEDTLTYTVRFQNTGNDTAFNVIVRDEIDANIDLSSFEFVSSSHDVRTFVDVENRVAEFYFNDIYLPDSNVNELASHGFVKFKVIGNEGLDENMVVNNSADIYFDQNPAIVTNRVSNTLVSVLPSPAS